ncbi:hypothetical protein SK128_002668, partial [Halocaridina rubra]
MRNSRVNEYATFTIIVRKLKSTIMHSFTTPQMTSNPNVTTQEIPNSTPQGGSCNLSFPEPSSDKDR